MWLEKATTTNSLKYKEILAAFQQKKIRSRVVAATVADILSCTSQFIIGIDETITQWYLVMSPRLQSTDHIYLHQTGSGHAFSISVRNDLQVTEEISPCLSSLHD